MKIKTSELTDKALDWAIANSKGLALHKDALLNGVIMAGWHASGWYSNSNHWVNLQQLNFETDWVQAGPIIDRELISVNATDALEGFKWEATCNPDQDVYFAQHGPTPN